MLKSEATQKIFEAAKSAGLSEAQADDLAALHIGRFTIDGDKVSFGSIEIGNADAFRQAIEKTPELAHLVPREVNVIDAVDAFVKRSPAARVRLMSQLNESERDKLAQQFGLRNFDDYRKGSAPPDFTAAAAKKSGDLNPWSAQGWNITAQMQYARRLGPAAAAERAKAAESFLGATSRKSRNLTSFK